VSTTPQNQDWFESNAPRNLTPAAQDWFASNAPKTASAPKPSFWESMGIVPSSDAIPPPLKPGEQAGPSFEGSPGELLSHASGQFAKEAGKFYATQGPGQLVEGAGEMAQGNISKGGHKAISGAMVTALPLMPEAIAANPLMAARAVAGGYVGGKAAEAGTAMAGGNEDQQKFAGDLGNLAGGFAAASGLPRALFESAAKSAMNKVATSVSGSLDPDIVGLISPRLAHLMRVASKVAEVTKSPVEGTAAGPVSADAAPATKPTAPAQPDYKLPNATYLRPEMRSLSQQPPTTGAKPDLLAGLREHEFLLKVQEELNRQGGDEQAQKEIDDWIEAHNQKAPGAKPQSAAAVAKARFQAARAEAESKANAVSGEAEQGGHAGGGVSSVEELNRPGNNYVVSKSGQLTYHGKSFDPGSIPNGSTHVTALPDGTLRVNAGPKLNPAQEMALKAALPKPATGVPRVPTSDADMEDLLMQSIKNAKARR
jgi:hypothetical protein